MSENLDYNPEGKPNSEEIIYQSFLRILKAEAMSDAASQNQLERYNKIKEIELVKGSPDLILEGNQMTPESFAKQLGIPQERVDEIKRKLGL